MLWLILVGSIPYLFIHLFCGYTGLAIYHVVGASVLGLLVIRNRDQKLRLIRVLTGFALIGFCAFYILALGIDAWVHLILLLTMFGLLQAFTFAKQDPWLVILQLTDLGVLVITLFVARYELVKPLIAPEDSIYYAFASMSIVIGSGIYLSVLYRKSARRYFQSAAIEASDFIKLVDNSPNAILVIDAQTHELIHANENFSALFQFEKLPGHLSELIRPSLETHDYHAIADTIDEKGLWTAVRELEGAKGRKVTCKLAISRIRIDQNQCNMIRIFDISNEIRIKKSLDTAQERLELALLASQDGIWEWNLETNEVYLSPRWKEMFGYKDHELENDDQTWTKLVFPEDIEPSRKAMFDFIRQKSSRFHITERYRHKDGHTVYVESRATQVIGKDGRTQKVVGSHTDITKLVEAQKQLEKAMEAANAASEAKSLFLANMSHEIRTPLLSILGFAEQLLEEELPASVQELVTIIQSSGKTLNQLLTDILDFERIRQGKLELNEAAFDPSQTIAELQRLYSHTAKQKNLKLLNDIEWEAGKHILGDELRFRQILINLLDNAFKFTEEGGVRISLRMLKGVFQPSLCVCVTDSGPGIPADFHENIFEIFTQYDPSLDRKYSGSGLGLGIVKRLVGLMEGTISFESPPSTPFPGSSQGSRFIFSIPVTLAEDSGPALAATESDALMLPESTVLLAEDNPLNQRIASHSLMKFGLKVLTAENGLEAVEKVESHPEIALVLMDIQMPQMDGYEASSRIKKIRPDLPVVGLSANAFQHDIDRFQTMGMNGYLPKPYSKEDLFHTLERFLGREGFKAS
ncbi:MAG: ATP-binding protein [Bacteroidia bacterium]